MSSGVLYIVATPIGNLGDFSQRAIDTLVSVDIIACEDTRVTQKLLNHFGINTQTISYHKFSEKERSQKLIGLLKSGKNVALVSDAGTPLISDPGSVLVQEARNENIKIVPISGPSAIITALSAIYNDGIFAFCGFVPQKVSEFEKFVKYINDFNLVFYESPNRIIKTLYLCKEIFGDITVSVARELTKIYEDINTFTVTDMINYLENGVVKGEIVLVLHKVSNVQPNLEYMEKAEKLIKLGYSAKDTSQIISAIFDVKKNEVYKNILEKSN